MIRIRAQILHQNGKPQFADIPYADFLAIQEKLEDAACLRKTLFRTRLRFPEVRKTVGSKMRWWMRVWKCVQIQSIGTVCGNSTFRLTEDYEFAMA